MTTTARIPRHVLIEIVSEAIGDTNARANEAQLADEHAEALRQVAREAEVVGIGNVLDDDAPKCPAGQACLWTAEHVRVGSVGPGVVSFGFAFDRIAQGRLGDKVLVLEVVDA